MQKRPNITLLGRFLLFMETLRVLCKLNCFMNILDGLWLQGGDHLGRKAGGQ